MKFGCRAEVKERGKGHAVPAERDRCHSAHDRCPAVTLHTYHIPGYKPLIAMIYSNFGLSPGTSTRY